MLYVREPTPLPSIPQPLRRWQIFFRHPGYDDSNNVLFKLYAMDTDTDGSHNTEQDGSQALGIPGLYAQFALDACAVIAGNRTDGWLSTLRDPDDARKAQIDAASILHARNYYFHLDRENGTDDDSGSDEPYPIVPTFREWRFPHDRIPAHWQQLSPNAAPLDSIFSPSNLTTALQIRDGSCRISGHREGLQVAHIVPQAELDWWKGNDMSRYNLGPVDTLDDTANAMFLRADLHINFDKSRFIFIPKPSGDGSGMRLRLHLFEPSAEYEHFYHNRELHTSAVGVEMLYARFAWSLFPLLSAFLSCRKSRRLAVSIPVDGEADSRGFFAATFCEQFSVSAARKRSQSPKKRKPEHDSAIEHTEPEGFMVPNDGKRRFDGTTSPDAYSAERARRCLERTPTHLEPSCSPLVLPLSPPDSRESSHPLTPPLAKAWLDVERQRSDPQGTWNNVNKWMQDVWGGETLSEEEAKRWLEVSGVEVRDI
ncbi:hypothetical protein GQ44DRAFT_732977 [Phaeosphaeriaceae sp. PMI808]|nr:hypothetical protein GQ44DRAFT_732977 [Phaeosphaeriaceae sp. PMI808]